MRAKPALLILGSIVAAACLPFGGCVDERLPTQLRTHPTAWNDPASVDFHGARVLMRGDAECLECHKAVGPGVNRVPSCDECHLNGGGHPQGWMTPSSPNFHGNSVAARGPRPCAQCHGADYRGGTVGISCFTCHADGPSGHPDGWLNENSASFHGLRVRQQGTADCERCHGANLGGGTSGVACSRCHEGEGGGD
jgi:hypothetical protein